MSNLETITIENSSPMHGFHLCLYQISTCIWTRVGATSNSGERNLPACRLGEMGFALSSERGPDPPLPAPAPADGLKAGGDIEASITVLLCTGPDGKYLVCSKDLARGFCCRRELSPRAILKLLTWWNVSKHFSAPNMLLPLASTTSTCFIRETAPLAATGWGKK